LPVVAPLVLFVIAGMLAVIPWRWSVAAFAVIFGAANALSARTPDAYSAWGRCHISADTYRLIVGSAKFVTTIEPQLSEALLWFDEQEIARTSRNCPIQLARVGYSLAGAGVPYIAPPFPMPPAARLQASTLSNAAADNSIVVIPWEHRATVSTFLEATQRAGIQAVEAGSRQFTVGGTPVHLTVLRLHIDPERIRRVATSPGRDLADWNADDLVRQLAVNTYAVPRREVLQRGSAGEPLFVPATPQDHLAAAFFEVPRSAEPRTLVIDSTAGRRPPVQCVIFVQDQELRPLGHAECGDAAAGQTLVERPATVTRVRIYFQGRGSDPVVLPQRLTISEHAGSAAASSGATAGR
jgi:hypothetical protein